MATFRLGVAPRGRVGEIDAFYAAHRSEFLWPRTQVELHDYADEGYLYEAVEIVDDAPPRIAAACYLKTNDEGPAEFGGVVADDAVQGTGLAKALTTFAISSFLVADNRDIRLIAHVHVDNDKPLRLLASVGFVQQAEPERYVGEGIPKTMKLDEGDGLNGYTHDFDEARVKHQFADWFLNFDGKLKKDHALQLPTSLDTPEKRGLFAEALRNGEEPPTA